MYCTFYQRPRYFVFKVGINSKYLRIRDVLNIRRRASDWHVVRKIVWNAVCVPIYLSNCATVIWVKFYFLRTYLLLWDQRSRPLFNNATRGTVWYILNSNSIVNTSCIVCWRQLKKIRCHLTSIAWYAQDVLIELPARESGYMKVMWTYVVLCFLLFDVCHRLRTLYPCLK